MFAEGGHASATRLLEGIQAVMVLYGRKLDTTETYRSLAASAVCAEAVLDLLVYDNSPDTQVMPADTGFIRINYRHDPANSGVSVAYNAGARLAREQDKKWLLLLDQDTFFPLEALAAYVSAVRNYGESNMFVPQLLAEGRLFSPCGYRAGIGYHLSRIKPGILNLDRCSVLNSGILVKLAAFDACGGYDERVKVDFADFAFINRFRRLYEKIVVLDLVCTHGFSDLEAVDIETALRRFAGYCRDGRASAVTPLLKISHAFLVVRRCMVLSIRYGSFRFLARLAAYFAPARGTKPI